jgi:hypothetical protein
MSSPRTIACSSTEYHADTTALSHSGLDDLLADPKDFYQRRILKLYDQEPTDAQSLGTRLHSALLVPGEYGSGVVTIPSEVLSKSGSRAGMAYREFVSQNEGKELIKAGEPLACMIEAGRSDPMIRALLETDGDFEHTIFWRDDEYGFDRKARLDFLHLDRETIVDLKTTSKGVSPDALAGTVEFWGYHRQAAYYQDAVRELYGIEARFVLIFFSTERPYNVAVIELHRDYIDFGREENARGLKKYAECLRTGIWLPDTHGKIITISPRGSLRWKKEWNLST